MNEYVMTYYTGEYDTKWKWIVAPDIHAADELADTIAAHLGTIVCDVYTQAEWDVR